MLVRLKSCRQQPSACILLSLITDTDAQASASIIRSLSCNFISNRCCFFLLCDSGAIVRFRVMCSWRFYWLQSKLESLAILKSHRTVQVPIGCYFTFQISHFHRCNFSASKSLPVTSLYDCNYHYAIEL